MSPHTKRAMALKKLNKERLARQHGQRDKVHHHRNGGTERQHQRRHPGQQHQQAHHPYTTSHDTVDSLDRQLFDYIIVVDIEATCERDSNNYPHEIIEIPGLLIDVRRGIVDAKRSFRSYVKPRLRPVLTEFCKTLTGISQEDVDAAPSLPEVVKNFERWYRETIPAGAKVAFAADGPWDFKKFIYEHSILRDHVSFPSIFYEYLDIRLTFAHHFNRGILIKLDTMLRRMGLKFEGRPHCGFDDAFNIARLAVAMMRVGCIFNYLFVIPMEDNYHYELEGIPLYRREEGSGKLDPDIVNDIAKRCYGMEYFLFGERHRMEVLQYREKHHDELLDAGLKHMQDELHRSRLAIRSRMVAICVLAFVSMVMLGVLGYTRLAKWWN